MTEKREGGKTGRIRASVAVDADRNNWEAWVRLVAGLGSFGSWRGFVWSPGVGSFGSWAWVRLVG